MLSTRDMLSTSGVDDYYNADLDIVYYIFLSIFLPNIGIFKRYHYEYRV
jgi:hypothetical protein